MVEVFLVGLGGALGAISRYLVGTLTDSTSAAMRFPIGTLIVNIVGCFLIGLISVVLLRYWPLSPNARLFLITGVLGGFTTFSAFSFETVAMIKADHLVAALLYVLVSVLVGLLATYVGIRIVS